MYPSHPVIAARSRGRGLRLPVTCSITSAIVRSRNPSISSRASGSAAALCISLTQARAFASIQAKYLSRLRASCSSGVASSPGSIAD